MENEKVARRTALLAAHGAIAFLMGGYIHDALPNIDHDLAGALTRMLFMASIGAGLAYLSLHKLKAADFFELFSVLMLACWPIGLLVFGMFWTG